MTSEAKQRQVFVNAVDDPANASAYLGGVVRRAGVTFAISTDGRAPALAGLLREGLDAALPEEELEAWVAEAERLRERTPLVFVDFHAEATSEKVAMGWHLDGKVTAVVGTHTHVQTADERLLPRRTAYITDVGMTGSHDSVIGVEISPVLKRFVSGMPSRFETASANPRINGVVITADSTTGQALGIERVNLSVAAVDMRASKPVSLS